MSRTTHPAGPRGRRSRESSGRTLGMVLTGATAPAAAGQVTGTAESDTSRVRNKLRKFLQRRPTLQSLRERGYIKGACERGWIGGMLGWGWIGGMLGWGWIMGCWDGAGSRIRTEMRVNPEWLLRWGVGIGPIKDGCWNGAESLGMSPGWRVGGDSREWSWDSQGWSWDAGLSDQAQP